MSNFGDTDTHLSTPEPQIEEHLDLATNYQALFNKPSEAPEMPANLELRQIAGLTSGTVMPLDRGTFHFKNSGSDDGFSLHVESRSRVMVAPSDSFLRIDDENLDGPTRLGSSVLDVGNARFIVRSRQSERRKLGLEIPADALSVVEVPTHFHSSHPEPPQPTSVEEEPLAKRRILGSFKSGRWNDPTSPDPTPSHLPVRTQKSEGRGLGNFRSGRWAEIDLTQPLDALSWEFMEDVREIRREQAELHRALHPHPEEIMYRLNAGARGLWNREPHHSLFGRVCVALGDVPWSPLFDNPEAIPLHLKYHIAELKTLPSVPVTANLPMGPLGIFGHRPAALAIARQAFLSIATTCKPGLFDFGVFADDQFVGDWEWVNHLPHRFFEGDRNAQPFVFTDGTVGYQRAGQVYGDGRHNAGLVVVADSVQDLPADCGTVIQVDEVGYCRVTNHLGEMIDATPVGITEQYAENLTRLITATLGDR